MTVQVTLVQVLTWIWSKHDQIGVFLSMLVFFWMRLPQERKAALGAKLPRFAHLFDLFAAIAMNVIQAKQEWKRFKSGAPYVAPPDPPKKEDENDG